MIKYFKKILNSIYIMILMIVLIILLIIQTTKDFIVSAFKIDNKKDKIKKETTNSRKNQLAKHNNP